MQLISSALHSVIVHNPDFASRDGHISLTDRIAAVHIAYHFSEEKIFWLSELVYHLPSILRHLKDTVPSDSHEIVCTAKAPFSNPIEYHLFCFVGFAPVCSADSFREAKASP